MAETVPSAGRRITAAAAAAVLLLAAGALLWPRDRSASGAVPLLVCDPSGRQDRIEAVYAPLARVLAEAAGRPVALSVVTRSGELRAAAAAGPCFVLAPDALALDLGRERFTPLAVGRGPVPRNLRPRGVLVWRRRAGEQDEPWRTRPGRTVLGDTLSLSAGGVFALGGAAAPAGLAAGPDPYDHGPALHAARLGGFDYALVRQWDAERFLDAGLLDAEDWGVRPLTPPVPDVVLLAARSLPRRQRLAAGDALAAVGRDGDGGASSAGLAAGLERLQLAGFNLLLEPDLDLVRGQLRGHWPRDGE